MRPLLKLAAVVPNVQQTLALFDEEPVVAQTFGIAETLLYGWLFDQARSFCSERLGEAIVVLCSCRYPPDLVRRQWKSPDCPFRESQPNEGLNRHHHAADAAWDHIGVRASSGRTNRPNKCFGKIADVCIKVRVAQSKSAEQLDAFVENEIVCICLGLGKCLPSIWVR